MSGNSHDTTTQARSIARIVDRLTPNHYVLHLTKGDKHQPWRLVILRECKVVENRELEKRQS